MTETYIKLRLEGGEAYVRRDKLDQLRRVNAAIFDCDGVLIDIRDSYNSAISRAVTCILESLIGYSPPESLISNEIIFLFRKSGGFNNDWDTVYGILMFILNGLPERLQGTLKRCVETFGWQPDPSERLSSVSEAMKKESGGIDLDEGFFMGLIDKLKEFTESLDATGIDSVNRVLIGDAETPKSLIDFYNVMKRFLRYPGEVRESVITRVFEEIFCGSELFRETYGIEPRFHLGPGMIENEHVIIQPETLNHLELIFGKASFGISSGSIFKYAERILGGLLGRFNPRALVFMDDILRAERECSSKTGLAVNLKKPNAFLLLKTAEALNPFEFALYVGDSVEDAIMVWEAGKTNPRFLFAGVYEYSDPKDAFLRNFLKAGCDIILPSVNDLPLILEEIRREEI